MLQEILDFLQRNIVFVIIVGGYLLSALGGLITRAAQGRKRDPMQEQQRRAREERREATSRPLIEPEPASRPQQARRPGGGVPDEEDIAAEIRRMMGLEPATVQELDEDPWGEREAAPPPEVQIVPADAPVRRLRPASDQRVEVGPSVRERNRRHRRSARRKGAERGSLERVRALVHEDARAAIVAAEVLGPPRALSPWGERGPAAGGPGR